MKWNVLFITDQSIRPMVQFFYHLSITKELFLTLSWNKLFIFPTAAYIFHNLVQIIINMRQIYEDIRRLSSSIAKTYCHNFQFRFLFSRKSFRFLVS